MAGWQLDPVEETAAAVVTPLEQIGEDVKDAVEATLTYCQKNPGKRLVTPPFATEDSRKKAAIDIRSYCQQRPKGRLTASVQKPNMHPVSKKAGFFLSLKVKAYTPKPRAKVDETTQNSDT
jgi:hypothetical protein